MHCDFLITFGVLRVSVEYSLSTFQQSLGDKCDSQPVNMISIDGLAIVAISFWW